MASHEGSQPLWAHAPGDGEDRLGMRRRWILWRQGYWYTVHGRRNPEPPHGFPYRHKATAEAMAKLRTRLTRDHHWVYRYGSHH